MEAKTRDKSCYTWRCMISVSSLGVQITDGVEDDPVQGRVNVMHRRQRLRRDLPVHGNGERAQDLSAVGAHDRGTNENPSVGIFDE